MDNKNQENLQSRREFFKSAAKATLPIIGAVVLSSLPISTIKASGCDEGSCYARCMNGCVHSCSGSCRGCSGSCGALCTVCCN